MAAKRAAGDSDSDYDDSDPKRKRREITNGEDPKLVAPTHHRPANSDL